MGFSISYRSTSPISDETADAIRKAVRDANRGHTWLSCEPVDFFAKKVDGHLWGASKPNFQPHSDDVASAKRQNVPDGTVNDLLEILCQISRSHGVDWEISHDHSSGPIGFIRRGIADEVVKNQIEAFAELGDVLGSFDEDFADAASDAFSFHDTDMQPSDRPDRDDDEPRILRLWPKPT